LKTISIDSPQFTLEGMLREAAEGEIVFLTTDGLPRFALVAVDEGDQEVLALRSNADFMAYLDECKLRAMQEPTKSLEEIKKLFAAEEAAPESRLNEGASPEETHDPRHPPAELG
jgi:antitoxin (DNA-binding transcriptional repressor) of toxin-antitoxin stability system